MTITAEEFHACLFEVHKFIKTVNERFSDTNLIEARHRIEGALGHSIEQTLGDLEHVLYLTDKYADQINNDENARERLTESIQETGRRLAQLAKEFDNLPK